MVKKKAYLVDCPDCMPLLTQFPTSCLGELIKGIRAIISGQPVEDIECLVHCAESIQWWAVSQWLSGHVHAKTTTVDGKAVTAEVDLEAAAVELETLQGIKGLKKAKAAVLKGAINWALVMAAILKLIEIIKPFLDQEESDPE